MNPEKMWLFTIEFIELQESLHIWISRYFQKIYNSFQTDHMLWLQEGSDLTFYNCRNKEGFSVNGQMEENEQNFDTGFCEWDMVTGPSGTFFR